MVPYKLIIVLPDSSDPQRRQYVPAAIVPEGTWDAEGDPVEFQALALRHDLKRFRSFSSLKLERPENGDWDQIESDIIQTLGRFAFGDDTEVTILNGTIGQTVQITPRAKEINVQISDLLHPKPIGY